MRLSLEAVGRSKALANLADERKSLAENTVEELLQMADEFDAMAARASTQDAKQALERLGARFRIFAAGRASNRRNGSVLPGAPPQQREICAA